MTKTQQAIHKIQKREEKLIRQCLVILKTSVGRIQKQGTGCNIPGYGASYKHGNLRDAIAILIPKSRVYNDTFGPIDEEPQRYIEAAIARTYSIDDLQRKKFREFLVELQDIHDEAFDEYYHVDGDRMAKFLNDCKILEAKLQQKLLTNATEEH